ncbi:MAG: hypothetical protein OHK0013_44200 [Sandaracinaceae bacterium]
MSLRSFASPSVGARALGLLGAVLATLVIVGCGGPGSVSGFARQSQPGRRIAVVSLAINDFGGALQGWNSTRTSDLMASRAAQMVQIAETALSQRFEVVPAAAFVTSPAYQAVPHGAHEVAVPVVNGAIMPVFGMSRGELVGASMQPDQAAALCAAAGTDYIAVIYSEWGVATGGFVPTSKALTKTVVSIFDAQGVHVARTRLDERGGRTLGAFGRVVVDDTTIDEWVGAYGASITRMLQ